MPFKLKFDKPPMGYSANSASEGETVQIITMEFSSSEDGMDFIRLLEGFPSTIIERLPDSVRCSSTEHMLVIMNKSGEATIYVNELEQSMKTRIRRSVKAGEAIFENDIVDISEFRFHDVDIPNDHAVLVIFSKGWRKGLFFDFSPIHPDGKPRQYDLWKTLGHYFSYLSYQELFALSNDQWDFFLSEKWFPFNSLNVQTLKGMISGASEKRSPDLLLDTVISETKQALPSMLERWEKSPVFSEHIELLKKAVEHFETGDFMSAVAIIVPRIEGLLRSLGEELNLNSLTQASLSSAPNEISEIEEHRFSKLLPSRFTTYLKDVYFAPFEQGNVSDASRNSVGHGVAPVTSFNQKTAVTAILSVDQIYFLIPPRGESES